MSEKIYLAGPLFSHAERDFNSKLCTDLILRTSAIIYLPQSVEHEGQIAIYNSHITHLNWCDTVVAITDGPDCDSGTAFEVGYAVGLGKRIILVRSDFRRCGDSAKAPGNLMMVMPAAHVVEQTSIKDSYESLLDDICQALQTY